MGKSIRHSLTTLLPLFFAVSLLSCGSNGGENTSGAAESSQAPVGEIYSTAEAGSLHPIAGVWVSGGYSLIVKSDNTYARDFNHDDIPVVLGRMKVSGNVIIVNDESGGRYACAQSATGQGTTGSYTYIISGNTLTFTFFYDSCSDRASFFGLVYARQ